MYVVLRARLGPLQDDALIVLALTHTLYVHNTYMRS